MAVKKGSGQVDKAVNAEKWTAGDAVANAYEIPALVALVFREKTGCRQYPMASVDELERFASRHPYNAERLKIMPVKGGEILPAFIVPACIAAKALSAVLS